MITVIKIFPWFLILYGIWGGYVLYEERIIEVENSDGEISSLNNKLNKLKQTKKDIESYYSDRDLAKDNMKKIAKDFEIVQKKLPEKQDDREIFDLFRRIAKRMLIKDFKITMGKNTSKDSYTEKSYTVNGNGTYLQFLLFFEALYKEEKLFDIRDILFRTVQVQELGRFQVIEGQFDIKTYVYNVSASKGKTNEAVQ